jgi:hypothetical protein
MGSALGGGGVQPASAANASAPMPMRANAMQPFPVLPLRPD